MSYELRRGEFLISTDPALIDLDAVHGFLSRSYWAAGIPREVVARSIQHSLTFGMYRLPEAAEPRNSNSPHQPAPQKEAGETARAGRKQYEQIGFARVITDRATFAYLSDVFIAPAHQGRGLGKWLLTAILAHPDLQNLRRFCLLTRDAQPLYAPFGFRPLDDPGRYMERLDRDVYKRKDTNAPQ